MLFKPLFNFNTCAINSLYFPVHCSSKIIFLFISFTILFQSQVFSTVIQIYIYIFFFHIYGTYIFHIYIPLKRNMHMYFFHILFPNRQLGNIECSSLFIQKVLVSYLSYIGSCSVTKSCLTPCNPVDCSLPGSSVHGIFQSRAQQRIAVSLSRGSS